MDAILVSSIDHGATPPSCAGRAHGRQHRRDAVSHRSRPGSCRSTSITAGRSKTARDSSAAIIARANETKSRSTTLRRPKLARHESRRRADDRLRASHPHEGPAHEAAVRAGGRGGRRRANARRRRPRDGDRRSRRTGKPLPINVDGAIGAILADLGLDPRVFNGIFMIARTPGLVAHVTEEQTRERPMRRIDPVNHAYDGPTPRRRATHGFELHEHGLRTRATSHEDLHALNQIAELFPDLMQIRDAGLRDKVAAVWNEALTTGCGGKGWTFDEIRAIPFTLLAGKIDMRFVEHLNSCVKQCIAIAKVLNEVFGDRVPVNHDVLVAGALLADVGKMLEFDKNAQRRSRQGPLRRHAPPPVQRRRAVLQARHPARGDAHHRHALHEGDKVERTIESWIFHHADFIDFDIAKVLGKKSKCNAQCTRLERGLFAGDGNRDCVRLSGTFLEDMKLDSLRSTGSCSSGSGSGGPRRCSARSSWACSRCSRSSRSMAKRSAKRLELHPRRARDFLDALVALEMLERDGTGADAKYRNTPDTDFSSTATNPRTPAESWRCATRGCTRSGARSPRPAHRSAAERDRSPAATTSSRRSTAIRRGCGSSSPA